MFTVSIDIGDCPCDGSVTIESCCRNAGLTLALRSTLKKHPGSTHWHWKKPDESGTLEITLWPKGRCVLLCVHSGRDAPWIREILPRLEAVLRREFSGE